MGKKPAVSQATKLKLKEAFMKLYAQKNIEKISIREITDIAGYNRGTFYLYYKDVYDILKEIEDSLFEDLKKILIPDKLISIDFDSLMEMVTELYNSQRNYMVVLLSEHGDISFLKKLKDYFHCFLEESLLLNYDGDRIQKEYILEYCSFGLMWLIVKWINEGQQMDIEEFILLLIELLSSVVR